MQIKKGFTLIELLLVVFIISISYGLIVNTFNFKKDPPLTLKNLKSTLKNHVFNKSIKVVCLDDDHVCYKIIDNEIDNENSFRLFNQTPVVYIQDKQQRFSKIEFDSIKIDDFYKSVEFEFELTKEYSDEIVVEYGEKIYYFKAIDDDAKIYSNFSEMEQVISEYRESLKVATSAL